MPNLLESKTAIRKKQRTQRQTLSPQERRKRSQALLKNIELRSELLNCHRIGVYWPARGEIDPWPLLQTQVFKLKKQCYLPVLHPLNHHQLLFIKYTSGEPLITNRFGVQEPQLNTHKLITPWALDLVLVPLLAFDNRGHRLGSGKGFYDRTFAFIKTEQRPLHPRLIGLAYDFQYYEQLPTNEWDIKLSGVAAENHFFHFTS
jgi:5-formyltetrahydrofolate cyclo-ligase